MVLNVDSATGLLPPGRHQADWPDIEDALVKHAPNSAERAGIYVLLRSWAESAWVLFPNSALWLDGGFVTHKASAPLDADVVIIAPRAEISHAFSVAQAEENAWRSAMAAGIEPPKCPTSLRLWGLLTLQDVASNYGVPVPRVQPYGGRIDGFLADAGDAAQLAYWNGLWSGVTGQTGVQKGFVEVTS